MNRKFAAKQTSSFKQKFQGKPRISGEKQRRKENYSNNDDESDEEDSADEEEENSGSDWSDDNEEEDQDGGISSGSENRPGKEDEEIDPNVPLYQLLQQRQTDSQTTSRAMHMRKKIKNRPKPSSDSDHESDSSIEGRKRKNAPAEMRSDRPVKRLRIDADNSKKKFIDPRFMDYTGELSPTHYAKNYSFLEDIKQQELQQLKKKYAKLKNETMKQELKQEMNKIKQQLNEKKLATTAMEKFEEMKKLEKQKQKELGKKPYFFKNTIKKQLVDEERYTLLKKERKLKKFMEKKQKKISQREKRLMPQQRYFKEEG